MRCDLMRNGAGLLVMAVLLMTAACGNEMPAPWPAPRPAGRKANNLAPAIEAALSRADRLEVLSLHPSISKTPPPDAFHEWSVLGRTEVTDPARARQILAAVSRGIQESNGTKALCFEPRHGIRARSGGATVDLVICFACYQIEAYMAGEQMSGAAIAPSPQAVLDGVLRDANVPLAKR